jgi:serine/threonine protein kinase
MPVPRPVLGYVPGTLPPLPSAYSSATTRRAGLGASAPPAPTRFADLVRMNLPGVSLLTHLDSRSRVDSRDRLLPPKRRARNRDVVEEDEDAESRDDDGDRRRGVKGAAGLPDPKDWPKIWTCRIHGDTATPSASSTLPSVGTGAPAPPSPMSRSTQVIRFQVVCNPERTAIESVHLLGTCADLAHRMSDEMAKSLSKPLPSSSPSSSTHPSPAPVSSSAHKREGKDEKEVKDAKDKSSESKKDARSESGSRPKTSTATSTATATAPPCFAPMYTTPFATTWIASAGWNHTQILPCVTVDPSSSSSSRSSGRHSGGGTSSDDTAHLGGQSTPASQSSDSSYSMISEDLKKGLWVLRWEPHDRLDVHRVEHIFAERTAANVVMRHAIGGLLDERLHTLSPGPGSAVHTVELSMHDIEMRLMQLHILPPYAYGCFQGRSYSISPQLSNKNVFDTLCAEKPLYLSLFRERFTDDEREHAWLVRRTKRLSYQMVLAMAMLHSLGFQHNDYKPDNACVCVTSPLSSTHGTATDTKKEERQPESESKAAPSSMSASGSGSVGAVPGDGAGAETVAAGGPGARTQTPTVAPDKASRDPGPRDGALTRGIGTWAQVRKRIDLLKRAKSDSECVFMIDLESCTQSIVHPQMPAVPNILHTPAYLAPERSGIAYGVSFASDVWTLGIILLELVGFVSLDPPVRDTHGALRYRSAFGLRPSTDYLGRYLLFGAEWTHPNKEDDRSDEEKHRFCLSPREARWTGPVVCYEDYVALANGDQPPPPPPLDVWTTMHHLTWTLPELPRVLLRCYGSRGASLFCDLLNGCLTLEPEFRMTAAEAAAHAFWRNTHCSGFDDMPSILEPAASGLRGPVSYSSLVRAWTAPRLTLSSPLHPASSGTSLSIEELRQQWGLGSEPARTDIPDIVLFAAFQILAHLPSRERRLPLDVLASLFHVIYYQLRGAVRLRAIVKHLLGTEKVAEPVLWTIRLRAEEMRVRFGYTMPVLYHPHLLRLTP